VQDVLVRTQQDVLVRMQDVLAGYPACKMDALSIVVCIGNIYYVFLSILRHSAILHASCLQEMILHSRPSFFSPVHLKLYLLRLVFVSPPYRVRDHFRPCYVVIILAYSSRLGANTRKQDLIEKVIYRENSKRLVQLYHPAC
jgi:hypothetical protein